MPTVTTNKFTRFHAALRDFWSLAFAMQFNAAGPKHADPRTQRKVSYTRMAAALLELQRAAVVPTHPINDRDPHDWVNELLADANELGGSSGAAVHNPESERTQKLFSALRDCERRLEALADLPELVTDEAETGTDLKLEVCEWTLPQPMKHWASMFDKTERTMLDWFKAGNIRANKVGGSWRVARYELLSKDYKKPQ